MKNLFFLLFILFLLPVSLFSFEMTLYWEVSHPEIPGFGYDAAGVGDVNNDGFADVLVANNWAEDIHRAYLYFGGSPMDTVADLIFEIPFFHTVSGDWNGDSISDIMVAYNNQLLVFCGGEDIDTIPDFRIDKPDSFPPNFCVEIAAGGDLNNDGYDEVYCGCYRPNTGYIFWGGSTTAVTTSLPLYYGVSDFGDVNGDEYDDLILSDIDNKTYIFFGSTDFDTIPDIVFDYPANRVYISDINGDGYGDALIKGDYMYVYLGGEDMDTCYDAAFRGGTKKIFKVNRDGYDDIIGVDLSVPARVVFLGSADLDTTWDWFPHTLYENRARNNFSYDVNGDGVDDIHFADWPGPSLVYLYTGDPSYTEIDEPPAGELVNTLALFNNYPNPFNSSTVLKFHIPESKRGVKTKLTIYNILGEKVRTLLDKPLQGADYEIIWDGKDASGKDVPSGTYFAELRFGYVFKRIKLQLLK